MLMHIIILVGPRPAALRADRRPLMRVHFVSREPVGIPTVYAGNTALYSKAEAALTLVTREC